MTKSETLPRHPRLTEKHNVALAEGSTEVLLDIGREGGYKSVGEYLRALAEHQIKIMRPADFARIKGVG